MKTFRIVFAGILLGLIGFQVAAQRVDRVGEMLANDPGKTFKVYKYEIKEDIARPAVYKTQKAFEEADSLGADLVLIHMNTYGGAVDAADSIRTRILQSKIPVMVFIDNNAASAGALISIACDRIYMRTGANMGAATVVDATGQVVPDKFQSYMRSTMRSTAEAKGRDPEIAQAMVDPSFEIPGLVDEGKVLTFTASEAIEWGYSEGIAENVDEVMKVAGIENYEFVEQKFSWIEKLIGFLISPVVSGLLIMLIIGGIYFELQTPGIGFPILAAAVAALLYFAPLYIEGLASHWEIAFFIVGIILIAVEIFAIPGFGVTGVLGVIFVLIGLTMSMVGNDGWDFSGVPAREVLVAFSIVIIALFLSLASSFYIGQKLFTPSRRFKGFALNTVQETDSGYTSASPQMKSLLGKTGTAFTVLRPSGKVEVEDDIYDATALTGYIEKGEAIKVVKYETSQVFVVKV